MDIPFSGQDDVIRLKTSPLFESACVLVRFNRVARCFVNANRPMMGDGYEPVEASTIVQYFTIDA